MPPHPSCQPKLAYLLILCGIAFIFTTGFTGPRLVDSDTVATRRVSVAELRAAAEAQRMPSLSAGSFLVYDVDANQVLFEQQAHQSLPPASLTKLMTALLVLEHGELDAEVAIVASDLMGDASMGLRAGERLTVTDLLYGLLIPSGNDAAMALARFVAGSVDEFVQRMNARAAELGLQATHFVNVHGLDAEGHVSSAADLLLLTRLAMSHPLFRVIIAQSSAVVAGHTLSNTNELLGTFPGADGVKTGTTDLAGQCLVASITRDGHQVLIVILGSRDRYADTQALYQMYERNFAWSQGRAQDLSALNRVRSGDGAIWYLATRDPAPVVLRRHWGMHELEPYRRLQLPTMPELWQPGTPAGVLEWRMGGVLIGTQQLVFR